MTTVIRIDPDDELPVILERLPSGVDCVLVLPPHSRALNSAVGAKLLSRRAEALGSRVAVVTADHAVIAHARTAGVPVAETVDEAQRILGDDVDTEPIAPLDAQPTAERSRWASKESSPENRPVGDSNGAAERAIRYDAETEIHSAVRDPDAVTAPPSGHKGPATTGTNRQSSGATTGTGGQGAGAAGTHGQADSTATGARGRGARRGPSAGAATAGTPPGRARTSRLSAGPGRFIMPAALVILPLLLLGWLAVYVLGGLLNPSATLTLRPRADVVTSSTTVSGVINLPAAKRGPYRVAMSRVEQAEQATVAVPVRGIQLVPDHAATGLIELANTSAKPLLVPAGTTFTTALNKAAFVSTRDVTLPAATLTFTSAVYGFGTAPIKAVTGGRAGNVPRLAIVNVPASFTGVINVQNAEPTQGGTDKPVKVVAPHDLAVAAANLVGALTQKAGQDIARRLNGDVAQNVLWVDHSPAVPRLAPDRRSATLTMSIVVHSVYVHRHDLVPAATAALQPVIAARSQETFIPGSLRWTAAWTVDKPINATTSWDPRTAMTQTIALAVTGHMKAPLAWDSLLRAISGHSKSDAMAYLKGRGDVDVLGDITISPPWADHLPNDTTRIHVNVLEPQ